MLHTHFFYFFPILDEIVGISVRIIGSFEIISSCTLNLSFSFFIPTVPIQSHSSDEGNRMQRMLLSSSLSTFDVSILNISTIHSPLHPSLFTLFFGKKNQQHSSISSDENSIDSVNLGTSTATSTRESASMARAQEDYKEITFERPEKASIQKRDAVVIMTTEASQSATLSSVEEDNNTTNNAEVDSLSPSTSSTTTTTTETSASPSLEKYPYSESNHPQAHLVSITTNPPAAAAATARFSPSQIDYLHHQPRQSSPSSIPFCYEPNGNLRYVSNNFQPQGVWSSVHYYYSDPYYSSLVEHRYK